MSQCNNPKASLHSATIFRCVREEGHSGDHCAGGLSWLNINGEQEALVSDLANAILTALQEDQKVAAEAVYNATKIKLEPRDYGVESWVAARAAIEHLSREGGE